MGLIDEMKKSEIRIWCKLKSFGLSDFAVAAVMGQIFAESGLRANNLQNSANKSLGMTDEEYTAGVDNGTYTNFVRDKKGYGLCQWTFWSRKEALLKHAQETHRSIGDEEMQIEYLWTELQQNKTVKNALLTSTSIRFISDTLLHDYEQPADQSIKMEQLRYGYAVGYYDKYAGKDIEELKAEIADTPKEEPKGNTPLDGIEIKPAGGMPIRKKHILKIRGRISTGIDIILIPTDMLL